MTALPVLDFGLIYPGPVDEHRSGTCSEIG